MKAVWVLYRAVFKRPKEGDPDPMSSVPIDVRLAKLAEELRNPGTGGELTSGLVRQAAKLVVEQLLQTEVADQLGRPRYVRREGERSGNADAAGGGRGGQAPADRDDGVAKAAAGSAFAGYRNGSKPRQLRTAEGKVHLELPQVRDADDCAQYCWGDHPGPPTPK
jgi:transposase-like protein